MKPFEDIKSLVITLLKKKLPKELVYHSLEHTLYVLEQVTQIAVHENISEKDLLLLKIGALFHDIGFISNRKQHEKESCKILEEHQAVLGISNDDMQLIFGMIMATKIPQQPKTPLECILADADLEYLATDGFEITSEKLYQELQTFQGDFSRKKWNEIQIAFFESHQYHTAYCKENKAPHKALNLQKIKAL